MTRRYRILFAGTETVDEKAALHLTLAPLVDPRRDRLRDLWIASDSFRPVRARVAGNFTGKAESGVPWLIAFTTVDDATYVASETSEGAVRRGTATFDRVEIRFENVRPDRSATADLRFARPRSVAGLNAIEEPPETPVAGGC
ncbi:MAG TPA: hypothetical protein VHT53_05005, partial [Candidatus Elarobacter sp.]|nr:hypothetical protein [Candidatus Elarobacter sp.]